jgi:hypothetical protein
MRIWMREASEHWKIVAASTRLRSGLAPVSNLSTQAIAFARTGFSLDATHMIFYSGQLLKVCTRITAPSQTRETLSTLPQR